MKLWILSTAKPAGGISRAETASFLCYETRAQAEALAEHHHPDGMRAFRVDVPDFVISFRCSDCHGINIQGTAWIDLNTGLDAGGEPPDDDCYCSDCEATSGSGHVKACCLESPTDPRGPYHPSPTAECFDHDRHHPHRETMRAAAKARREFRKETRTA